MPSRRPWLGIRFALGTFIPQLTPGRLSDRHDVILPAASSRSVWLHGSAWEYPTFENADTFVDRLLRKGTITRDAVVSAVLGHRPARLPIRSAQRHFVGATGITHRTLRQIERARSATTLVKPDGLSLDSANQAARQWIRLNYVRAVLAWAGWLGALKALSL